MAFFRNDIFQDYANNMQPLQPIATQEVITLDPIQVEGGPQAGQAPTRKSPKMAFIERLLGQQETPTDNIDTSGEVMNATVSSNPRKGGLFRDLINGAQENFDNSFNINNWDDNQLADGRKKGFAYRLGEGLGSIARGMSGWAGDAWTAGYEGLDAGMNRQAIRTADKIYRKQLQDQGFDTSDVNGYINNDIYKNFENNVWRYKKLDQNTYIKMKSLYDRQLQQGILTPEQYQMNVEALNNQYVNSQIQTMQTGDVNVSNQTRNTDMSEELLPYKKYALATAPQVALGNLGLRTNIFNYKKTRDAKEDAEDAGVGMPSPFNNGGSMPTPQPRKGRAF